MKRPRLLSFMFVNFLIIWLLNGWYDWWFPNSTWYETGHFSKEMVIFYGIVYLTLSDYLRWEKK
jgi:hypothetical protein